MEDEFDRGILEKTNLDFGLPYDSNAHGLLDVAALSQLGGILGQVLHLRCDL